jgi:hypothetical protein
MAVAIVSCYLFVVTGKGQRWMENRKAFELTSIINIYNILQVLANIYIVAQSLFYVAKTQNFKFFCIPVPHDDFSPAAMKVLHVFHIYFLLKVVDLFDTVSIVRTFDK